jgi:AraC-like DNA-binding protein
MQLEESESELGRWRSAHRSAAEALRSHARGYFGSEGFIPMALRERHLPVAGVALIINFADPHRLIERDEGDMGWGQRAWVAGLQTRPRVSEATGAREFLAVSLTPTGAWRLLRTPMDVLTDRVVDLEDIDPVFARRLVARVSTAPSWQARFEGLDDVFLERFAAEPAVPTVAPMLIQQLSTGAGDIGRLAAEIGRSHRWLIARFRAEVGLPPKTMARLLRFNRALAAINKTRRLNWSDGKPYLESLEPAEPGEAPPWPDLALDCGYYDQAHFINEFRTFAGATPSAFLRGFAEKPLAA